MTRPKPPIKTCGGCQNPFPRNTDHFNRDRSRGDGLHRLCKVCHRAAASLWKRTNPERDNANSRRWRARNPIKTRLQRYLRWLKNPERYREHARRQRRTHPDRVHATGRKYRQTHQNIMSAKGARYRARLQQAPINDLTAKDWIAIKQAFDYRCAYCGTKPKRLEKDHVTPLARQGNNTLQNIVPACGRCNARKGAGAPLRPVQPLLLA